MTVATAETKAKIKTLDFEEKYKTGYCIPLWLRDQQVKLAIKKVPGRVKPYEGKREDTVAVVCYGPSLNTTWEALRDYKYIITCSGAHRFLIDRGIIPTWHLDVDPRAHKIGVVGEIHPDVTYLPCSTCHPNYFDALVAAKAKVELWHCFSTEAEALRVLPQGEYALTGGCDAGLRAMAVARFFGFVNQHVFGMDGCAADEKGHAAAHTNPMKKFFDMEYPKGSGRLYRTSPNIMEVAKTVPHEVDMLKLDSVEFKGEGLVQAIMAGHEPKKPKESNIAFVKPVLISDEYRAMNRKMHDERGDYGAGGSRHAPVVLKLCETLKTTSVLDYGCGKGTLANNIPFPIWEYDPAIDGKDEQPRPADIVVCTDVLEHIEPNLLPDVLANVAALTQKVGYFVVSTRPAKKTLADGRNAHLIQQDAKWWEKTLSKYFAIGQIFDEKDEVRIVVGPKKKAEKAENIVTVERNGTKAKFLVTNDVSAWRAKTLFTKEKCTIEWIESFNEGDVLYDVGANVGGYTVWAGVHRKAKVYSFEPAAVNYATLCRNIVINNIEGQAFCAAMTDENRMDTIYLSNEDAGSSCNSFGDSVGPSLEKRKGVPQGAIGYKLDSIIQQLPMPDHIKIDVDGFEHKVIAGANELLSSGRLKSILIEINGNLDEHKAMIKKIEGYGYRFEKGQVEEAERKDGPFKGCAEYVFRKVNPVEDALIAKIDAATVIEAPFPHIHLENVFQAKTLKRIQQWMKDKDYKPIAEARGVDGYPERSVHDAPEFMDWMRSGRLRRALDRKFAVQSSSDETVMLRDKPGYRIPPHTDTPSKAVTALFYVTPDWTPKEHGTSIYTPATKSFKCDNGIHHDREGFNEVWRASGKPNSVFIFARTDQSFHGCEPYEGTSKRDILLWDSRK